MATGRWLLLLPLLMEVLMADYATGNGKHPSTTNNH